MATPSTPNGGGSSSSSSSSSSNKGGQHAHFSGKKDVSSSSRHKKAVSVCIQPTIGPAFLLSLPPTTKIATLKETISDKMGLSPQKMTLLFHNNALSSGSLTENGIDDGSEVKLVPAIESGVTTTNSVDPVAMMKHSMSGISDQQIDDFLNGKFPLSVAIRVGESVVVVNLHRAKVEEIEMEPPLRKRRCVRARRPSSHDDMDGMESSATLSGKHSSSSRDNNYHRYLNSNHAPSDLMNVNDLSSSSHHHHHHHHHRRSSTMGSSKSHRSLGSSSGSSKNRDVGSRRHRKLSRDHSSPGTSHPLSHPDRSMLTYTRDISGAPMETSVATISAPPPGPMESSSRTPIPRSTPIISKDAPVVTTITTPCVGVESKRCGRIDSHEASIDVTSEEENMDDNGVSTTKQPGCSDINTATTTITEADMDTTASTPSVTTASVPSGSGGAQCYLENRSKSISRSVQTDPEPCAKDSGKTETREQLRVAISPRESGNSSRKVPTISGIKREMRLPESGISMKRKAVMEAISEILKKMYANTEKGRLPGSFKGRFSSEFTCDSDMREILHSKTTMTGYGSEEDPDKSGPCEADASNALSSDVANLSKVKLQEHQQIMDKVASLKWQMQNKRALRMAKRKGERSACGWMEALNCDMPGGKPKAIDCNGFCGLKRGFLLAD